MAPTPTPAFWRVLVSWACATVIFAVAVQGTAGTRIRSGIRAIYTFGDGTVAHQPGGCKHFSDWLAQYLGLPPAPSHLKRKANFSAGANFANDGATIFHYALPGTEIEKFANPEAPGSLSSRVMNEASRRQENNLLWALLQAKDLTGQLQAFTSFLHHHKDAKRRLPEALFVISAGGDDWLLYASQKMQDVATTHAYISKLVSAEVRFIRKIYAAGARRILVASAGPVGCLPILTSSPPFNNSQCVDSLNTVVATFNMQLQGALTDQSFLRHTRNAQTLFADCFDLVLQCSTNPTGSGFRKGLGACCGAGRERSEVPCGQTGTVQGKKVQGTPCKHPSDYVWWDAMHWGEAVSLLIAASMWAGPPSFISPRALQELVSQE